MIDRIRRAIAPPSPEPAAGGLPWGELYTLVDQEYVHPIKSQVANTATTIVCPAAGAAVSWHVVVDYYTGP